MGMTTPEAVRRAILIDLRAVAGTSLAKKFEFEQTLLDAACLIETLQTELAACRSTVTNGDRS